MASISRPAPSRDKVAAHRKRLRRQGLRPIQIWVPDVRTRAFSAQAHAQSLAVARSPHAKNDQGFIDEVSDCLGPKESGE
jgi:hypothetical protein